MANILEYNMTLLNADSKTSSRGNEPIRSVPGHPANLRQPEPLLAEKSRVLQEHIINEIRNHQGAISFADYLSLALYTTELGYYSGPAEKFGKMGDFVTAPELSPLFSRCLAKFCQEIMLNLGDGDILELGAGSGQMAADILSELYEQRSLPKHYYIFEISLLLRKRQQTTLQKNLALKYGEKTSEEILARVQWLNTNELVGLTNPLSVTSPSDCLPTNSFRGVILANEVLDALPVHRFTIKEGHFYLNNVVEREVRGESEENGTSGGLLGFEDDNICFCHPNNLTKNIDDVDSLNMIINHFQSSNLFNIDIQDKSFIYHSEINLYLKNWIADLASILQSGVMLFIDYGFPRHEYYHPDRSMGTLMCHYRHRAHHDPFFYPGLQDITAHVDFTHVAEAALAANLEVVGYTNQASFLIDMGLIEFLTRTEPSPVDATDNHPTFHHSKKSIETLKLNQAVNILTSPAEMGELFKAIAFSKNYEGDVPGFGMHDMRNRL